MLPWELQCICRALVIVLCCSVVETTYVCAYFGHSVLPFKSFGNTTHFRLYLDEELKVNKVE